MTIGNMARKFQSIIPCFFTDITRISKQQSISLFSLRCRVSVIVCSVYSQAFSEDTHRSATMSPGCICLFCIDLLSTHTMSAVVPAGFSVGWRNRSVQCMIVAIGYTRDMAIYRRSFHYNIHKEGRQQNKSSIYVPGCV